MVWVTSVISIHALLAESDDLYHRSRRDVLYFYPRSPCGERRQVKQNCRAEISISIHALLAESDRLWIMLYSCPGNFYPRSPCGERPGKVKVVEPGFVFLSTLSLRRATVGQKRLRQKLAISIHALLAESDAFTLSDSSKASLFLSTLSLRRATTAKNSNIQLSTFLSTLSLRRATRCRHSSYPPA